MSKTSDREMVTVFQYCVTEQRVGSSVEGKKAYSRQ